MAQRESNSIATQRPKSGVATVQAMFERQSGQISAALAGQMDTQRFIRTAMTAYSRGDDRFQSSAPVSLLGACMKAAELGLSVDPMLGEFWLIPRRNRKKNCMWIDGQMGYKGLVKLARRNPHFRNVKAERVFKLDSFEYELGSTPFVRHTRDESDAEQELRLTYATIHYMDGSSTPHVSVMRDIVKARDRSESFRAGYGPWKDHFESMSMIVPLRALMKLEAIDGSLGEALIEQLAREDAGANELIELPVDGEEMPPSVDPPTSVAEIKAKFTVGEGEPG